MSYNFHNKDDSSESGAAASGSDSGTFVMGGRNPFNSANMFHFFNHKQQDRRGFLKGRSSQDSSSTAQRRSDRHSASDKFADNSQQRHPLFSKASSRYSLHPVVRSAETELEILLGRVFMTGFLSEVSGKEVIFNQIVELLSKPENSHLRSFKSRFQSKSVIELAIEHNNAGVLDNHIKTLKGLGCTYRPEYEAQLQRIFRKKNELAPIIEEPYARPGMGRR